MALEHDTGRTAGLYPLLFDTLRAHATAPHIRVEEVDAHINDPAFADAMAEQLLTNLAGSMHAVHRA